VGGLLLAVASWRWIFLVNIPAGLLGFGLGWFLLPRSRHLQPRQRFDWLGLGLFGPAVSCLLLALSLGRELGSSLRLLGLVVVAVALGAGFVVHERRTPTPMLDLALLGRRPFAARIASSLLSYLVLFGVLLVTPFFLEGELGLRPEQAGLVLSALPLALGVVAPAAGVLADRVGARLPTVAGMALATAALVAMALAHGSSSLLVAELAAVGLGLGAFTPANNAAIMDAAPAEQSGMAGGMLNMTRGIGTATGVALAGLVLSIAASHAGATHPQPASTGFAAAATMLAGVAALAAVLAALGPEQPPGSH
jgi:MFS family permease